MQLLVYLAPSFRMQCYVNVEAGLYYSMVSKTLQRCSSDLSSMLDINQNHYRNAQLVVSITLP